MQYTHSVQTSTFSWLQFHKFKFRLSFPHSCVYALVLHPCIFVGGTLGVPALNVEPPTPQSTSLTTKTVIPPIAVPASASPHDSTEDTDTGPSGGVSDRSSELYKKRLERRKRKKRHPPDSRGVTSLTQLVPISICSTYILFVLQDR